MNPTLERLVDDLPGIVVFLTLGVMAVAIWTNVVPVWLVAVVGFAVLLPLSGILSRALTGESTSVDDEAATTRREETAEAADALEDLRARYARGELTDAEFERRVENLLETESLHEAREFVENTDDAEWSGEHAVEDREREREPE